MKTADIRQLFLDFYREHDHLYVPSASLVPSSYDPSVLLTTAGMQPFKPYFSGLDTPPRTRVTSVQKCFRTPDIDQVGLTARHLTFFEMLGNFSFGDYFKKDAISMAWQLVTDKLGLDPNMLWVTVHEGSSALGLGPDSEAIELWKAAGVPDARIVQLGEDNFWKAGPTGPCGPCSEIYYDRGAEFGCNSDDCAPGCDCDRYLEFYNLVFMQFDRDAAGKLTPLPQQNIDTGMGLERIASLLQGNVSIFETDALRAIIAWVEKTSGRTYDEQADPIATKAMRVLADHGRGMTFLASDGVMPSNEGRGYVLRRLIRRAIQQADRIGMYERREPGVLGGLASLVIELFSDTYPELRAEQAVVLDLLAAEETRFLNTLDKGSALLGDVLDHTRAAGADTVPGDAAFQLHDTFGFPVELTEELAGELGLGIDRARFDELMREQRERARAASGSSVVAVDQAAVFARSAATTRFVGYDVLAADTQLTALQPIAAAPDGTPRALVKLAESPFYAEGGGQVSDSGSITGPDGRASVEAVLRFDGDQVLVVHIDGKLAADDTVRAEVAARVRRATEANHTATHLLHQALRDRLGDHVRQAGSLVEPGRLRFDFIHTAALSPEDIVAVEQSVNDHIGASEQVHWEEVDLDAARQRGAMMLFGEKYGERVRLVQIGDDNSAWSKELCGGTHVDATGSIRLFLIIGESSIGSNTRRIEALTGDGAIQYLRTRTEAAEQAAAAGGVDVDRLPLRVAELAQSHKRLERELTSLRSGGALDAALAARDAAGELSFVVYRDDSLGGDELLELADRVRSKLGDISAVALASAADDKVTLIVTATAQAVDAGVHAGNIVREIAPIVGGGGGGRPNMARAGGKDAARIDDALTRARELLCDVAGVAASN